MDKVNLRDRERISEHLEKVVNLWGPIIAWKACTLADNEINVVVLVRSHKCYITWLYNVETEAFYNGHYELEGIEEAARNFFNRYRYSYGTKEGCTITFLKDSTAEEKMEFTNHFNILSAQ